MTADLPRHLPKKATLRRRRVVAVPHTVFPVRVLFGSMVLDATGYPTAGPGAVGVIEAGVVFGRLRVLLPPGLSVHRRIETHQQGRVFSEAPEVPRGSDEPHVVLVAEIVRSTVSIEQWDHLSS